ncbi:MAG TPA: alpha-galactosidase [Spirochaetota bacterium]|nr:alpha-galactosidase [Spirochaetota bacterium]
MQLTFDDHSFEILYKTHNTAKVASINTLQHDNYLDDNLNVQYTRNRDAIQCIIKPITRLYIQKAILSLQVLTSDDIACFANGYQSWTYTGPFFKDSKKRKPWPQFVIANQENAAHPPKGKRGVVQSDMIFVLGDSNQQNAYVFGHLPVHKQFHQFVSFEYNYRTKLLSIIWDVDRFCDAEEDYTLDTVCILQGTVWKTMEYYAETIAQELSPTFNNTLRKGWCSWYYYYNTITRDEILLNAKYAKENSIPFDFIQIDDGYQATIGEWTTVRGSFTAAMRYIADTIKGYGFTPGIWYSPFIVSKDSRIFKENKSWILKDNNGKPVIAGFNPAWGGYYYTVDVTQPAALSWIEDTINTLLYEWGYEYLKLDFMYAAALPGVRHNTTISRYEALAQAVARIRKASGNAFILGCGMPLQAGIRYVDAMRIGPDVAPQWGRTFFDKLFNSDSGISTRSAICSSIYRSFMHNRFWVNDPDCLMIRQHKTKLNPEERQTLYNVITALGGMLVISDRLPDYSATEREMLLQAIALFDKAKDGDIYCNDVLRPLRSFYNAKGLGVLLNVDDTTCETTLEQEIMNNYSKIFLIEKNTKIPSHTKNFDLMPHSSKLFLFEK